MVDEKGGALNFWGGGEKRRVKDCGGEGDGRGGAGGRGGRGREGKGGFGLWIPFFFADWALDLFFYENIVYLRLQKFVCFFIILLFFIYLFVFFDCQLFLF